MQILCPTPLSHRDTTKPTAGSVLELLDRKTHLSSETPVQREQLLTHCSHDNHRRTVYIFSGDKPECEQYFLNALK
jgi:hypothetical protein